MLHIVPRSQLSPLLNDPEYRTIGIGTRVFIGGTHGYVSFQNSMIQDRYACQMAHPQVPQARWR